MSIDFASVVPVFDAILARGLSGGVGQRDGQMCIEAAVCAALGLPHGDDPKCVASAVRMFKIRLNDSRWSSPRARAEGLRRLGIAQLGSMGVVDDCEFTRRIAESTIRQLVPKLFRTLFPSNARCLTAADRCEAEGSREAAREAQVAASAVYAVAYAAYAADAYAAYAAASAADAAADGYLRLSADIAFGILADLKSPGALWLLAQEGATVS